MPVSQRSFVSFALGALAGGLVAAYATSAVYGGEGAKIEMRKDCPVCEPCSPCPPPGDCGEPTAEMVEGAVEGEDQLFDAKSKDRPGLPASALVLASEKLAVELKECTIDAPSGVSVALDLTITATGGVGRVSDAKVSAREGVAGEAAEACMVERARATTFEWTQNEGETRLLYPVQVP